MMSAFESLSLTRRSVCIWERSSGPRDVEKAVLHAPVVTSLLGAAGHEAVGLEMGRPPWPHSYSCMPSRESSRGVRAVLI